MSFPVIFGSKVTMRKDFAVCLVYKLKIGSISSLRNRIELISYSPHKGHVFFSNGFPLGLILSVLEEVTRRDIDQETNYLLILCMSSGCKTLCGCYINCL